MRAYAPQREYGAHADVIGVCPMRVLEQNGQVHTMYRVTDLLAETSVPIRSGHLTFRPSLGAQAGDAALLTECSESGSPLHHAWRQRKLRHHNCLRYASSAAQRICVRCDGVDFSRVAASAQAALGLHAEGGNQSAAAVCRYRHQWRSSLMVVAESSESI